MKDKEVIIESSIRKLNEKKIELSKQLDDLLKEKDRYEGMIWDLDDSEEEENIDLPPELQKIYKKVVEYSESIKNINDEMHFYIEELDKIETIIHFNGKIDNFDSLVKVVRSCKSFNSNSARVSYSSLTKLTGITCPIKASQLSDLETKMYKVGGRIDRYMFDKGTNSNPSKTKVVDDIHEITNTIDLSIFEKTCDFLNDARTFLDKKIDELIDKATFIRKEEASKKRRGLEEKVSNTQKRIDDIEKQLKKIEEINSLYEEYKKMSDRDTMVKLSGELSKLDVISKRDLKFLLHQKQEKKEEDEVIQDNVSKDKYVPIPLNQIIPLDMDYFKRKETKTIICFLGDGENPIYEDINKHFDNSNKHIVLRELNDLFRYLYINSEYKDIAGKPSNAASKATLSLLDSPYKFSYKRFGVSKDQFRIHAIERYSNLLNELGYGEGHIIFFGAVGVNDDTEKSFAYNRLGSRAMVDIARDEKFPILRKNFDYIEHITRRYIPKELLSKEDKLLLSKGDFNRRYKGGIDITIENGNYVLFDALDDTSKDNVSLYLNRYFMEQTDKMFKIINEYNSIKGDIL